VYGPVVWGLIHSGYQGSRGLKKKKENRLPWAEAPEPALAGRAVLKIELCHGPERTIALSIYLEKNSRNVDNFDAARTDNEACGHIVLRHRHPSIYINA
jgi:hypothetical protein